MRARPAGFVLIAGAAVYAVLVGAAGVTFNCTPLVIGVSACAAGLLGRSRRLVPIGLTLVGWGAAILLVRDGPLPDDRVAPAYLVGAAIGLLAAHAVARPWHLSLTGALMTALISGTVFYVAYDIDTLADWPVWAAALTVWGAFEVVRRPAV